jgi:hypothetical protein
VDVVGGKSQGKSEESDGVDEGGVLVDVAAAVLMMELRV